MYNTAAALGEAEQNEHKLQEQLAEANRALEGHSHMKKEIDDCNIQGVFNKAQENTVMRRIKHSYKKTSES